MKIGEQAMKIVGRWAAEQVRPLELKLTAADQPRTDELREFGQWLAGQCGRLTVSESAAPGEDLPALNLRQGAVIYRSVPMGTELEPFLEALAGEGDSGSGAFRPAALRIYVAAACPHCPNAVRSLLPLAVAGGPVTLEVIDSEVLGDLAEAEKIKSVPTVILDHTFRWTGSIRPGDLEAMLAAGDRWDLDSGVLQRLLEGGNAAPLAALIHEAGRVSPGLGRLLASDALSVRLGAMMVLEELLERSPELVEPLVPDLWGRLAKAPEPAQGDMLYIIGESGPLAMSAKISGFLESDPHPEVAEAAREALERLAERYP